MAAMPHVFLSPDWIETAEQIYERHSHHVAGRRFPAFVVNLVVTGAPFAIGDVEAHTDTTSGDLRIHRGNAAEPDLTLSLDYETARSLIVDQDPQLAIEALILGRITDRGGHGRAGGQDRSRPHAAPRPVDKPQPRQHRELGASRSDRGTYRRGAPKHYRLIIG